MLSLKKVLWNVLMRHTKSNINQETVQSEIAVLQWGANTLMVSGRECFTMTMVKIDVILTCRFFFLILEVTGEIQLEFEISQYS